LTDNRAVIDGPTQVVRSGWGRPFSSAIAVGDHEGQPAGDGRQVPVEIAGTERVLPADLVLLALGFTGPEDGLLGA